MGQGKNQSMTVPEMRPGKLRQRRRSFEPEGDMASTMCRLFLHRFT